MPTLKPCPFCGNEITPEIIPIGNSFIIVRCNECGGQSGYAFTVENAALSWNRRPELENQTDFTDDELRTLCEHCYTQKCMHIGLLNLEEKQTTPNEKVISYQNERISYYENIMCKLSKLFSQNYISEILSNVPDCQDRDDK